LKFDFMHETRNRVLIAAAIGMGALILTFGWPPIDFDHFMFPRLFYKLGMVALLCWLAAAMGWPPFFMKRG